MQPDVVAIVIGVLGGLSIFLFGMGQMTDALKTVAGGGMRTVLGKLTTNRIAAAFTGAFVTGVIQSSSVTTVLVVGFISAGLMTLQQSVGVIMGANIGSTVTAQLIAFKITDAALPLITIGFAMLFLSRRDWLRQLGTMIMGLGMIFAGMGVMGEATYPLRDYEPFVQMMQQDRGPLLAVAAAGIFTAIVQSSAATTGIVIVLAGQGLITLETGIALALGANIGTCATAVLAAIGKPRAALQAATVHVLFNVAGVLLWLPFIGFLAGVVREISPAASPELDAAARMAIETPRQIANAHTLFNIANTLVFLGFTGPIAKLVQKIIPDKPVEEPKIAQPLYLDPVFLETPALAIDRIRLELGHLGAEVIETFESVAPPEADAVLDPHSIAINIEDVSSIHAGIVGYAQDLLRREITTGESERIQGLLDASNHLQSIADTIAVNFGAIAREWTDRKLVASAETQRMFNAFAGRVREAIVLAVRAVSETDQDAGEHVLAMKATLAANSEALSKRLSERLTSTDPNRVDVYRLESEVIEVMKRLYYFAKRVGKIAIGEGGAPDALEQAA